MPLPLPLSTVVPPAAALLQFAHSTGSKGLQRAARRAPVLGGASRTHSTTSAPPAICGSLPPSARKMGVVRRGCSTGAPGAQSGWGPAIKQHLQPRPRRHLLHRQVGPRLSSQDLSGTHTKPPHQFWWVNLLTPRCAEDLWRQPQTCSSPSQLCRVRSCLSQSQA